MNDEFLVEVPAFCQSIAFMGSVMIFKTGSVMIFKTNSHYFPKQQNHLTYAIGMQCFLTNELRLCYLDEAEAPYGQSSIHSTFPVTQIQDTALGNHHTNFHSGYRTLRFIRWYWRFARKFSVLSFPCYYAPKFSCFFSVTLRHSKRITTL